MSEQQAEVSFESQMRAYREEIDAFKQDVLDIGNKVQQPETWANLLVGDVALPIAQQRIQTGLNTLYEGNKPYLKFKLRQLTGVSQEEAEQAVSDPLAFIKTQGRARFEQAIGRKLGEPGEGPGLLERLGIDIPDLTAQDLLSPEQGATKIAAAVARGVKSTAKSAVQGTVDTVKAAAKDIRAQVSQSIADARQQTADTLAQARQDFTDAVQTGRKEFGTALQEGRGMVSDLGREAAQGLADGRAAVRQAVAQGRDAAREAVNAAGEAASEVKGEVRGAVQAGRQAIGEATGEARALAQEASGAVRATVADVSDQVADTSSLARATLQDTVAAGRAGLAEGTSVINAGVAQGRDAVAGVARQAGQTLTEARTAAQDTMAAGRGALQQASTEVRGAAADVRATVGEGVRAGKDLLTASRLEAQDAISAGRDIAASLGGDEAEWTRILTASRQATAQYARAGIQQARMASVIPREAIGELRAAANPGVLDPNASLRVSDPAEIWPRDLPRLYDPTSEVQFPARPLTVDSVREALGVDQTASVIGRAELNTRGLYDRAANGLARLAGKGKGAVDTLGGRIQGIRQPDLPELPDFEGLANPPALPTGQALDDLRAAVQTGQDVLADTSA